MIDRFRDSPNKGETLAGATDPTIRGQQHHSLQRLFARPDRLDHPLYVVTSVYNSQRYRSRWKLYEDFALYVAQSGAELYTVEIALGDRDFVVTDSYNPRHLQLRTWHELWFKECAINLMVQRLPADWKKVAWIDADMFFVRSDWADETKHALEHWPVVQMWSQMSDISYSQEFNGFGKSFAEYWRTEGRAAKRKLPKVYPNLYYYHAPGAYPGPPGLAWAMRREAWEILGGLIDYAIVGACDWYMAHALTSQCDRLFGRRQKTGLPAKVWEWQDRAERGRWNERPIAGNIGVVQGAAVHRFHGHKRFRHYVSRENILRKHKFDPDTDLKRDWQGLWQITDRKPQLRRDLQTYFHQRNEDATE